MFYVLKTSCSFPLSGIFGDNVASKLNKETKSTDKMGHCRVGLELIFRKPGNDFGRQTADMDESEEADEGQLKSRGFWFHGKKVSLRPKTHFDMDESEEADEGQLKSRGFWFHGKKVSALQPKTPFDMDESEEADEGQLKSRGFWFHGKKASAVQPKTPFDMDESEEADEGQLKSRGFWFHGKKVSLRPKTEEADEGSLKVNSGIGVGKKRSNLWGSRRRRYRIGISLRRRWGR